MVKVFNISIWLRRLTRIETGDVVVIDLFTRPCFRAQNQTIGTSSCEKRKSSRFISNIEFLVAKYTEESITRVETIGELSAEVGLPGRHIRVRSLELLPLALPHDVVPACTEMSLERLVHLAGAFSEVVHGDTSGRMRFVAVGRETRLTPVIDTAGINIACLLYTSDAADD